MKQKVISTMLLLSMGQHSLQDVEQQQETEQKAEQALLMQKRERLSISIHGTTSFEQELRLFTRRLKKLLKMVQLHTSRMVQKFIG